MSETWRVFFVYLLAVPPPRFRPPSVVGGITAENPQNVQLAKVLAEVGLARHAPSHQPATRVLQLLPP